MACDNAMKNVFMFNMHCSNGSKTMRRSVGLNKKKNSFEGLLIGVTVLTNLGQEDIDEMFKSSMKLEELVLNMATMARDSGLCGIVCSPHESEIIKGEARKRIYNGMSGVRPKFTLDSEGKSGDDQNRIMTPYDAIKSRVDFLVVGRPITKSGNPLEATEMILKEIYEAM